MQTMRNALTLTPNRRRIALLTFLSFIALM